jgi:hypothetical protein
MAAIFFRPTLERFFSKSRRSRCGFAGAEAYLDRQRSPEEQREAWRRPSSATLDEARRISESPDAFWPDAATSRTKITAPFFQVAMLNRMRQADLIYFIKRLAHASGYD